MTNKKDFFWNMLGTTLNAFISLFLMIIVVRINGTNISGTFTLMFSLACLFCIIIGYEGLVFHVTDITNQINNREYIIHRYITFAMMFICIFIYIFIKNYNINKILILLGLALLKGLESIAEIYYGIMQKNGFLYKVGISLTLKAFLTVIIFLSVDYITKNILLAILSADFIWLILLIYDIKNAHHFILKEETIDINNILKIFKNGFFSFALLFLFIYVSSISKYLLDGRVEEHLQTIYGIIIMPASVVSLFGQYLLNPYLTSLSNSLKKKDIKMFKKIINHIFTIIFIGSIIIILATFILGIPVLNIIYGIKLDAYLNNLIIIILGAILYTCGSYFYTSLVAIIKTFVQFILYVIIAIIGTIISLFAINIYGLIGACGSYFITMFLQFSMYLIVYKVIIKRDLRSE